MTHDLPPTAADHTRLHRRAVLAAGSAALLAAAAAPALAARRLVHPDHEPALKISLAQWSLHKALFAGEIDNLDFPRIARERYSIGAVEFVNAFFKDKPTDREYLKDLRGRAKDHGVKCLLIMCDGLGRLGDPSDAERTKAVENHKPWLDAASALGCHSIRVNAASEGEYDEQLRLAADGLRRLAELGHAQGLNVIVENHGGLSSNGAWLAAVMQRVDHPRCGTLPDFGNFCLDWSRKDDPAAWYDRYTGTKELMPYARAVSAKSYDFDDAGNETTIDYRRMLTIVKDAGYKGYVGIEYEGSRLSEHEGVLATQTLLGRLIAELSTDA